MEVPTQPTQPTQATQAAFDHLTQESLEDGTICRLICTTGQLNNVDLKIKRNGLKEWYFGRNAACDITYTNTTRLSNKHFKIWSGDSNVLIQDLSTNGTYVNNSRLVKGQNYILSQGDEVSVGIGVAKDVVRFIVFFPKASSIQNSSTRIDEGINKEFSIKDEVIGQGAFAIVKKAVERATGKTYAVKIISKRKIMGNTDGVSRELEILRRLDHPGIVRLRGFYEDDDSYYLVMEFVPGGDLMDFVAAHGAVGEEAGKEITKQILQAVKYVHSLEISHRDLKPDNILIAQDDPVMVKITDFGLAKISDNGTFMKTFCGTLAYVAPEVIDGRLSKVTDDNKYSSLVDMWSLGCLVYVILTAHLPFSGSTQDQLYKQIQQGTYHEPPLKEAGVSKEARSFLDSLLQTDPRKRITASAALSHPWILSSSQQLSQISLSQSQSQQHRLEVEKLQVDDANLELNKDISDEPVFKIPAPPNNNKNKKPQQQKDDTSQPSQASQASQQKTAQITNKSFTEDNSFDRTSLIENGNVNNTPVKGQDIIKPETPQTIEKKTSEATASSTATKYPPGTSLTLTPTSKSVNHKEIFIPQGVSPYVIGRNAVCHETIAQDRLSKIHCAFTKKRHPVGMSLYESPAQGLEDIWLIDFSTNACYINGTKIGRGKKALVYNNDEIMLFNDNNKKERLAFKVHIIDGTGIFNNGESPYGEHTTRETVEQDDFDRSSLPKIVLPNNVTEKKRMDDKNYRKRLAPKENVSQRPIKRAALDKGDINSSFQTALR
ncbi:Carbon catabolite-derepressing protein kinase [Wickerhamomyces ciferrii]|uniref:Serine/threonine-protein kinase RAD53 n=1 Tax=Wickerhamomyces ciferrii (strain ATCC 14091 / BCRC 22168 / CBS 111 / JCM 3599 / NBRC 0793 / NRRL Y-1031 F-60-10) TaxID=1206466 RepID=K0KML2_WICCF|nr:Carbon catabolite-derepressing protein kinase [Wickerhamomyces ciferrii]CCH43442.1 Carbon catabolite-derepressing protein kinase [Wickerhamomyces ciferrii]